MFINKYVKNRSIKSHQVRLKTWSFDKKVWSEKEMPKRKVVDFNIVPTNILYLI